MRRRQILITAPQSELLEKESERTGLSVSELIRRAIDEFISTYPFVASKL